MDIRKFFSASGPSDEKSEKQNFTANQPVSRSMKGSGLSKERQLNLSPSPKQTKKSNLRANVSNVVISSEEDTDGECPISDQLKKEVRKNRKTKIISSDEEDAITSANALRQPVSSADENITRCSPRKKKPFSHEALSPVLLSDAPAPSKGKDVARRNPRKLITDMEPIHGVVTNKKRKRNCKDAKDAQKDEVNEVVPKRSKLAGSKQVDCDEMPMGVFANEEKGTVKTKKSDRSNTKLNIPAVSNLNKKRSSEKLIDIDARSNTRTSSSSPKKSKTKLQKTVVTANIPEDMTIKGTMHLMASRPTQNSDQEALKKQLDLPWVDKYKPIQQKELVGQHTDKSPFNKLVSWLRDWPKYNLGVRALQKKSRPNQYQAQSDGTSFKAALLSGPPGIGKTTCGVFACKQLNLQYLELNASDSRGKKAIESQVSSLLEDNRMDKYYFSSAGKVTSKVLGINQVLIMDEVDGMSGNQDRSGIMELIQMIKRTKVPIICICNDRQSQKIRSLANYCFDLRFTRPRAEQIKGRLQTIAYKENLKIPSETLDKIIEASNQDLRQCIHSLQLMNSGSSKADQRFQKKDISVNIFEAARTCLSSDSTLAEKQEMFFSDYSMMPLFVQENYPNVRSSRVGNALHMRCISRAAESIAFGDIIGRQVRSLNAWSLLVDQAMFSCALPATIMDGHLNEQIAFPAWFGKFSAANKRQRLMRELALHAHLGISGSNHALVVDYLPVLRDRLYRPLVEKDPAVAVKQVLEVYKSYNLVREDTEAINELGVWPNRKDIVQLVPTKSKSALTRALNKEPRSLPFAQKSSAVVKGRKKEAKVGDDKSSGSDSGKEDVDEVNEEEELF